MPVFVPRLLDLAAFPVPDSESGVDSPKFIATSENWTSVQIWEEAQFQMLTPTLFVNRAANDPSEGIGFHNHGAGPF